MTQQQILPDQIAGGVPEPGGGGGSRVLSAFASGALTLSTGTTRIYNDSGETLTILSVRASVGSAPTGGPVTVDVNKNGVTIYTTQANRPTIAAGSVTSKTVPDVTTIADGEFFTIDIDTIGPTAPGSHLTVQIEVTT